MTTQNIYDMSDTWNDGGTTFVAIKMDVTDSASDSASLLMDLQVGSAPMLTVSKSRQMYLYNTYTDASNYERLSIDWSTTSNEATIISEAAGTGTARQLLLKGGATGGSIVLGNGLSVSVTTTLQLILNASNKVIFYCTSDGKLRLSNKTQNDFKMLLFGGSSTSYPALTREGATIGIKLGDDSAFTSLQALDILTETSKGTAGTGVTATEYGDGYNRQTKLVLAGVLPAITGDTAEAEGLLIYTFPAGVIVVDSVHMDASITQSQGNITNDTPLVGIGSVIATGSVSVLNGTTGFDDYVVEQTSADCSGTKTDKTEITASSVRLIEAGDEHKVHFNAADAWDASAGGDTAPAVGGDVWISWRFLGA